jgi:hypothetical protein
MAHVFVSFVSEDAKLAHWVSSQLKSNGLEPWFSEDAGRILPGQNWKDALRAAIEDGGYYVPIFTAQWVKRQRSVANEELMFAAEEARLRQSGLPWIVPLLVHKVQLPSVDLGGGRRLSDIHYSDVPKLGWERGLTSLLTALGVASPTLERGDPISEGFGSTAKIIGGFVTYRNLSLPIPELEGTSFTVTGGSVQRGAEGELIAQFSLRAPFETLQQLNEQLGMDRIDVRSTDQVISRDPTKPSQFKFVDEKDQRPPGSEFWEMGASELPRSTVSIQQVSGYDAYGYLNADDQMEGTFSGFVETVTQLGQIRVTFEGEFMLQLKESLGPPFETSKATV